MLARRRACLAFDRCTSLGSVPDAGVAAFIRRAVTKANDKSAAFSCMNVGRIAMHRS